jgi:citronellyl-CoA dehydrogenase
VINGSKMWITNGMQADWCCLLANTSAEGGPHRNKSLIMVPMDAPGISRQKIIKIGMDASDTAQIFFDDVRVPQRNLSSARKAWASPTRCCSSRRSGCGARRAACA